MPGVLLGSLQIQGNLNGIVNLLPDFFEGAGQKLTGHVARLDVVLLERKGERLHGPDQQESHLLRVPDERENEVERLRRFDPVKQQVPVQLHGDDTLLRSPKGSCRCC